MPQRAQPGVLDENLDRRCREHPLDRHLPRADNAHRLDGLARQRATQIRSDYPTTNAPMIRTENLSKTYDALTAVNDLNLHIAQGEFFAFLGPNGAGKTTTIKLLTGLL